MDEAFDLKWSLQHKDDIRELTLRPEVRQFLDVAVVADQRKHIEPAIFIRSNRAIATFAERPATYRFDIGVFGDGGAKALLSLKIEETEHWSTPKVSVVV